MLDRPKTGLWPSVIPNGFAARFVYERTWLRGGQINPRVFLPCAVNGVWESSVCLHDLLGEHDAVKPVGASIGAKRGKPLVGWADFPVSDVPGATDGRLCVTPSPSKDNPRHANILGWGDKAQHLLLAARLAAIAQPYLT